MTNIIALSLNSPAPIKPLPFRKCYKCHIVKPIDKYDKAPLPDTANQGYTWACISCLRRDSLSYEGGFK